MKWFPVTDVNAIPKKEGRRVSFGKEEVALFNVGDKFHAVSNACPHKKGPLADGIVSGSSVFCPLHNLKINLESGCAEDGACVKVYPVKVFQEKICVGIEEGAG